MRQLAAMTEPEIREVLSELGRAQRRELEQRWYGFENDGQRDPPGDWRVWLIRAGRGFGKTRAGSEWVSEIARANPGARIALVGATQPDGQRVMIDGPSGLLAVARAGETPHWVRARRELRFSSGAVATLYSAEAGEESPAAGEGAPPVSLARVATARRVRPATTATARTAATRRRRR